jgi:hypothetical protein
MTIQKLYVRITPCEKDYWNPLLSLVAQFWRLSPISKGGKYEYDAVVFNGDRRFFYYSWHFLVLYFNKR